MSQEQNPLGQEKRKVEDHAKELTGLYEDIVQESGENNSIGMRDDFGELEEKYLSGAHDKFKVYWQSIPESEKEGVIEVLKKHTKKQNLDYILKEIEYCKPK